MALLCHVLSSDASAGEASADAFIACAARDATPLRDDTQFAALGRIVGDARLIALGEPAHGAREPLELRNRIIQYLVEHMGLTAVALETSFGESRVVYDYVKQGRDSTSAPSVARESLTWGFGRFPENVALIRWLHDYNASAAHDRKVHFYGMDLSGADNQGSFSRARASVDRSLEVLGTVDPAQAAKIRSQIEPALVLFSDADFGKLSDAQDKALQRGLLSIGEGFTQQRAELTSRLGRDRYEWALHELIVAQRLQAYFRAAPRVASKGDDLPADGYVQDEIRDAVMAENVRWILKQESERGRVFVFAHDAHVMNAPLRGGIWSVYPRAPRAMGDFLRAAVGSSMVIIGTLAATDLPESTEAVLARISTSPFLLDLRKAACDDAAVAWLAQRRSVQMNYHTELDVELRNAFDAIVYLNRIERRK